nr:hypothetical protein [Thiomonas sp. 13-64-67]
MSVPTIYRWIQRAPTR